MYLKGRSIYLVVLRMSSKEFDEDDADRVGNTNY